MGELFAIVIGIEKYQDLRPVLFAEADARAVSGALEDLGCPRSNQLLLLSGAATKTAIEADARTLLLGRVSEDDQCFLFFAGHGFSDGSHNYLAAHDTRQRSIESTSVRLQMLLGLIKACPSKRTVLFLDACHTGITVEETLRSSVSGIEPALDEEFCAGFASCRSDEKSYSSTKLKQGVWTHHLLQALRGEAKKALDGTLLTAVKLQKHLSEEVPRTIRAEFSNPRVQTPRFFGSFEAVGPIADLATLLTKRRAEKEAESLHLNQVTLVATTNTRIASLRGFNKKKGHFIPDSPSGAAERFVRSLATEEVQEHIDEKYESLRKRMKVKIKDIETSVSDGAGTIRVPAFDYNVSATQNPEDPSEVLWRYELLNVRDPSVIQDDAFNDVFGNTFDVVEFTFTGEMPDIRQLAGDLEDAGYEVECPRDYSYCSFEPEGADATVKITPGSVEFVFARKHAPRVLVEGFRSAYALLAGQAAVARLLNG